MESSPDSKEVNKLGVFIVAAIFFAAVGVSIAALAGALSWNTSNNRFHPPLPPYFPPNRTIVSGLLSALDPLIVTTINAGYKPVWMDFDSDNSFCYVLVNPSVFNQSQIQLYYFDDSAGSLTYETSTIITGAVSYFQTHPYLPWIITLDTLNSQLTIWYCDFYSGVVMGNYTNGGTSIAISTSSITFIVSPTGTNIYILNGLNSSISIYALGFQYPNPFINSTISFVSTVNTITNPNAITVDANSQWIYVASTTVDSVYVYNITDVNGTLVLIQSITVVGMAPVFSMSISADQQWLFAPDYAATPAAINQFAIGNQSGTYGMLTYQAAALSDGYPHMFLAHPTVANFSYSLCDSTNTVNMFIINNGTNQIQLQIPPSVPTEDNPKVFAFDNKGNFLYIADGTLLNIIGYVIN